MWTFLIAAPLVLPSAQTFSERLGPGFDDAVPVLDSGQALNFHTRAELGDVDGDGRLDVLLWTAAGDFSIQRNAGFGRFEAMPSNVPVASSGHEFTKFLVGELNGDGVLDLCLSRRIGPGPTGFGRTEVLFGDGAGGFAIGAWFSSDSPLNEPATDLELADFDGDGDLDVFQSSYGVLRLHLNLGAGQFDVGGLVLFSQSSNRAVQASPFDFGADGDLDLAIGVDSALGFVLEQQSPLDFVRVGSLGVLDGGPLIADLDGDGREDVVVSETYANSGNFTEVRVYRQAIAGLQLSQDFETLNEALISGLENLDADSEPDLLIVTGDNSNARRMSGLPGAQFDASMLLPFEDNSEAARGIRFGDLDGDGDLDAVGQGTQFSYRVPQLYFGNGVGSFVWLGVSRDIQTLQDRRAIGDMDGDGTLDIVRLGSTNDQQGGGTSAGVLQRGDGFGGWGEEERADYQIDTGFLDYDLGDLDGDGDIDLLVGTVADGGGPGPNVVADRNVVLLNDGVGGLTQEGSLELAIADFSAHVLLFDAQGDGDLDAFLGNQGPQMIAGGENRLVLNDGTGSFSDATVNLPALRGSSAGGVAADFDGDGDLDLLIGDRMITFSGEVNAEPRLWLNGGAGAFADASAQLPFAPLIFGDVIVADVDLDGDTDAFISSTYWDFPSGGPEWLLINDGAANFTTGTVPNIGNKRSSAGFVDVDWDGDPDLLRHVEGDLLVSLNSNGQFGAVEPFEGPPVVAGSEIATVDFDSDGDEDLVIGWVPMRSLMTELWAASPTSLGKDFQFELRAPGSGSSYLLAYSTGLTSLELPGLGLLRINPTASFGILGTGVLDAEGAAGVSGFVPNSPGLTGVTVFVQALLGSPARLSRALATELTTL